MNIGITHLWIKSKQYPYFEFYFPSFFILILENFLAITHSLAETLIPCLALSPFIKPFYLKARITFGMMIKTHYIKRTRDQISIIEYH